MLQSPFIALLGGDAVKSTVVLCYTVTVLSSTMSPSILGGFIKKLGTRRTIALGSILFGAGYVISGYTTSMAVFFLAFGLGTGVGSGLIYPTIMGYMASLYPDKRGSVSGIIAGVYGGASIFLSPMLAGMIESRSLSFALTVAGGAALVVIFAVAMLIQPVPQGYLEYKCGSGSAGAGRYGENCHVLCGNRCLCLWLYLRYDGHQSGVCHHAGELCPYCHSGGLLCVHHVLYEHVRALPLGHCHRPL